MYYNDPGCMCAHIRLLHCCSSGFAYTITYIHACMHAFIHTYIPTCMHAYIHTYIDMYTGVFGTLFAGGNVARSCMNHINKVCGHLWRRCAERCRFHPDTFLQGPIVSLAMASDGYGVPCLWVVQDTSRVPADFFAADPLGSALVPAPLLKTLVRVWALWIHSWFEQSHSHGAL